MKDSSQVNRDMNRFQGNSQAAVGGVFGSALGFLTGSGLVSQILLVIVAMVVLYSIITIVENIVNAVITYKKLLNLP